MSIEFKKAPHSEQALRPGVDVHEMWVDGKMVATIYPGDHPGVVRIMSRHFEDAVMTYIGDVGMLIMRFR